MNESFETDKQILECDCIWYISPTLAISYEVQSQVLIDSLREVSVSFFKFRSLELDFDVLTRSNGQHGDGHVICLVNLGSMAQFSESKLETICRKQPEVITKAHLSRLKCKLISSSKGEIDLSIDFHHDAAE